MRDPLCLILALPCSFEKREREREREREKEERERERERDRERLVSNKLGQHQLIT